MRTLILLAVLIVLTAPAALAQDTASQARNPMLYGLGSFVIPGLGQMFQGEIEKGLVHLGIGVAIPVAGVLVAIASPTGGLILSLLPAASLGWAVVSAFDSYQMALDYNEAQGFSALGNIPV